MVRFSTTKYGISLLTSLALGFIGVLVLLPTSVSSLSGSDFQASKIIDDFIFYNKSSMSTPSIQNFLDSKVPTCDTNGTQIYSGSTTRAQYGASRGYPAPYTCVKDYTETVPTIVNGGSDLCTTSITGGVKTSAEIIYDVSQACGINPQVLLVLLQKEQALITDDWPWSVQYRSATGYGCPDSAPCDSEYYGFFNQVYQAAKAFRRYEANPNSYNYKANRNNTIYYHPSLGACGSSNVFIENQATANLYIYTPYQPNAAALNNLYGTGDSCSAYGNRNFWRMFNDWFGSTLETYKLVRDGLSVNIVSPPYATPAVGQEISYIVSFTNNLSYQVSLDAIGVVGRAGNISTGTNRDFGWQGPLTISAGASQQFTFTTIIQDLGDTYIWPTLLYQGIYLQYNNWGSTIVSHTPNFSFSQPLVADSTNIYAGQNVTFSTVLKNNEPYPINYDAIGIPVKFYNRYNYDAIWVGPGTVGAGAEIILTGTRNIDKPGPFTYWVSRYFSGKYSTIGSTKNFNSTEASPNFSVSGLSFSNTSPVQGEALGASFTVTNNLPVPIDVDAVGVVGRLGTFSGLNRDIGWQGSIHFNAGETKSFTGFLRNITDVGTHYYWIGILHQGRYIQYNNWGSTIVSSGPNFSVSGLSFSNTSPVQGEALGASFTVTNNLPVPIDVDAVGVVGRLGTFSGLNRDIGWQGSIHFNAGETKSFTGFLRNITDVGTHYYWIGILHQGRYIQYNNWGSTIVSSP